MAPRLVETPGPCTHSPITRRPLWCTSMCSTLVPASEGPKASMMPATIRRDAHKPQACSGGSTALTWRSVTQLTSAAERDRSDPRVGIDSVIRLSQHKMVTFVNGNVRRFTEKSACSAVDVSVDAGNERLRSRRSHRVVRRDKIDLAVEIDPGHRAKHECSIVA